MTSELCTICASPAEPQHGAVVFVYDGREFHFCSLDCLKIFQAFPETYTTSETPELQSVEDSGY